MMTDTRIPILFLGDAPDRHGGLSRIGCDLATRLATDPELSQLVRVGYLGREAQGSRHLPFQQYSYHPDARCCEWGEGHLVEVWRDFVGPREHGVLFTVWDPSRTAWVGDPRFDGYQFADLRALLTGPQMTRWGYFAVDSTGAGDRLSKILAKGIEGYDRVLAYTSWGAGVLSRSINRPVPFLYHGIETEGYRAAAAIPHTPDPAVRIIGCMMTNQPRKDWGVWAGAAAIIKERLAARGIKARFLIHTDAITRHWNLQTLLHDFGLFWDTAITTRDMTDEEVCRWYATCDLTLLPSTEGFGYPIVESLAAGVPVVHVNYGGGAELLPMPMLVTPESYRLDTHFSMLRPVVHPAMMAEKALQLLDDMGTVSVGKVIIRDIDVARFDWEALWSEWRSWFKQGIDEVGRVYNETRMGPRS